MAERIMASRTEQISLTLANPASLVVGAQVRIWHDHKWLELGVIEHGEAPLQWRIRPSADAHVAHILQTMADGHVAGVEIAIAGLDHDCLDVMLSISDANVWLPVASFPRSGREESDQELNHSNRHGKAAHPHHSPAPTHAHGASSHGGGEGAGAHAAHGTHDLDSGPAELHHGAVATTT
jgi:hypothetical protein